MCGVPASPVTELVEEVTGEPTESEEEVGEWMWGWNTFARSVVGEMGEKGEKVGVSV